MKIRYVSDIHFEHMTDHGDAFASTFPTDGYDVLVLAGDIGQASGGALLHGMTALLERVTKPVIMVPGNHEFYNMAAASDPWEGGTVENARRRGQGGVRDVYSRLSKRFPQLRASVDPREETIGGVHFVAATMWFGSPGPNAPRNFMADYRYIRGVEHWVSGESLMHLRFIRRHATKDSVVITHHLPSQAAVDTRFATSALNCFFVHPDAESVIHENQPKVWIHGHSHSPLRGRIGNTAIRRNPLGYPGEGVSGFSLHETFDTEDPAMGCVHPDIVVQPPAAPGLTEFACRRVRS